MQAKQQSTTRNHPRSTATKPRENAFSLLYLERARRREVDPDPGERFADSPLARHARWTGPWEIERVPAGASWLHAAAAFAALATPNHLRVNGDKPSGRRSPLGHPLHDGKRHLGHVGSRLGRDGHDFLAYYHAIRCLAAIPTRPLSSWRRWTPRRSRCSAEPPSGGKADPPAPPEVVRTHPGWWTVEPTTGVGGARGPAFRQNRGAARPSGALRWRGRSA